jgi:hypothetical protein
MRPPHAPLLHGPQERRRRGRALASRHGGADMSASGQPARYEIRIEGLLDSHWAAWFEDLHLSNDSTQTVICGPLADQPALHGLLVKIRDLGLCLISVRRLDSGDAGDGAPL